MPRHWKRKGNVSTRAGETAELAMWRRDKSHICIASRSAIDLNGGLETVHSPLDLVDNTARLSCMERSQGKKTLTWAWGSDAKCGRSEEGTSK
jgi:hypothetical protein